MNAIAEYIKTGGRGAKSRLAEHMGVALITVSRWARKDHAPGRYRLPRLWEFLAEAKPVKDKAMRGKR